MSFWSRFLDSCFLVACASLLLLAAWSILQTGRIRRYPLPFAFFVTSACFAVILGSHTVLGILDRKLYVQFYWANELIEQGFALALMVLVIRLTLAGEKSMAILGQGIASLAVILVAALVIETPPNFSSRWMTSFTRNLSFGVALMNFQVWGLLIAKRVKSRELLLLASGLGLLTTGKSLGHTIRIVAAKGGWLEWIGNYIVVATALLAFYAWWTAFRPVKNRPQLVKAA